MSDEMTTHQPETPKEKPKKNFARLGLTIILVALAISILAFTLGYFSLYAEQSALRQSITEIERQFSEAQKLTVQLQNELAEGKQSINRSQEIANQQEALMNQWRQAEHGDQHQWKLAEARYLVRLANDQLMYNHNLEVAIQLLQESQSLIAQVNNPDLSSIQQKINEDITKLKGFPKVDVTETYTKMAAMAEHIDALPLKTHDQTAKEVAPSPVTVPKDESWWKTSMRKTLEGLQQIVVVRRTDSNALPLLMPDEKVFLYQNLHAQMAGAMWALLQRNEAVFQINLARSLGWLQTYFDVQNQTVKTYIQDIEQLRRLQLKQADVNLNETLNLFDQYATKVKEG